MLRMHMLRIYAGVAGLCSKATFGGLYGIGSQSWQQ